MSSFPRTVEVHRRSFCRVRGSLHGILESALGQVVSSYVDVAVGVLSRDVVDPYYVGRVRTLHIDIVVVVDVVTADIVVLRIVLCSKFTWADVIRWAKESWSRMKWSSLSVGVKRPELLRWAAPVYARSDNSRGEVVHGFHQAPLVCGDLRVPQLEILKLFRCYVSCGRNLLVLHVPELLHSVHDLFILTLSHLDDLRVRGAMSPLHCCILWTRVCIHVSHSIVEPLFFPLQCIDHVGFRGLGGRRLPPKPEGVRDARLCRSTGSTSKSSSSAVATSMSLSALYSPSCAVASKAWSLVAKLSH
jgi:hypothetical protein